MTSAAVAAGERETVMDLDEAEEMRGGVAWERAAGGGLVDARVGRPQRDGNGAAATDFRDEENEVLRCRDAVLMWPIGVGAGRPMRP